MMLKKNDTEKIKWAMFISGVFTVKFGKLLNIESNKKFSSTRTEVHFRWQLN